MSTESSTLDNYIVLNTIGRGYHAKIKAVRCCSTGVIYAAKIFRKQSSEILARNEANCLGQISGPNIISVVSIILHGRYIKKNQSEYHCIYILMELCSNGDLFDIISLLRPLSSELQRVLFQQIISAIESCHSFGICHRNLKLENFLFDSNFSIKLTDFECSARIDSPSHTVISESRFSAPETIRATQYRGDFADVFAAGIILFLIHSQNFPFFSVSPIDSFYKKFITNLPEFWESHVKNDKSLYSAEFKNLIEAMLNPNPQNRPTLEQIKNHSWTVGPTASIETLRNEILNRRQAALSQATNQYENRVRVLNNTRGLRGQYNPSSLSLSLDDLKIKPSKSVKCHKFGEILTGLEPNILLGRVSEYFVESGDSYQISSEFYQLRAKVVTHSDPLELKFTVYQKENFYVLDIELDKGNNIDFADVVTKLKQHIFLENNLRLE